MNPDNMEYLTVSKISKLCNVPVSALKYYEKIGLIKPAKIEKDTLYRYYSVCQYAQIETIRELRELDIPIATIKEYMRDRKLKSSLETLKRHYDNLNTRINELQETQKRMQEQIALVEECCNESDKDFIIKKKFIGERKVLIDDNLGNHDLNTLTDIDLSYSILEVEFLIGKNEKAATLARGKLGHFIPKEDLEEGNLMKSYPFIFVGHKDLQHKNLKILKAGEYICLMHFGRARDREPSLKAMLMYIKENGYTIAGDVVQVDLIDDTMSDCSEEFIFEIQIPVQKSKIPN
jgi:DNA-binding transcriptional MerR regulator/effector-binding domain-containing protein